MIHPCEPAVAAAVGCVRPGRALASSVPDAGRARLSRDSRASGRGRRTVPGDDYSERPGVGSDLEFDDRSSAIELHASAMPGERLDRFVASRLREFSRTRIQHWILLGAVRVDDEPAPAKRRLVGFERITVHPQPIEAETSFRPEPVPLDVVDEDDDLLVLDKRAGLVVHPGAGNWHGTLMNGLLSLRPSLAALPRAGIVHRLDKDTSGLLVVAKTERARESLIAQLGRREMSRQYLAIAQGSPPDAFEVDTPIGRDPRNRLRMSAASRAGGKPAQTSFRVIARQAGRDETQGARPLGAATGATGGEFVLLACRLHSGRTHQIRVHLSSRGFPIAGDALYGGAADGRFPRQMLHAWCLGLAHPRDGRLRRWISRLPSDFIAALASIGLSAPDLDGPGRPWIEGRG